MEQGTLSHLAHGDNSLILEENSRPLSTLQEPETRKSVNNGSKQISPNLSESPSKAEKRSRLETAVEDLDRPVIASQSYDLRGPTKKSDMLDGRPKNQLEIGRTASINGSKGDVELKLGSPGKQTQYISEATPSGTEATGSIVKMRPMHADWKYGPS